MGDNEGMSEPIDTVDPTLAGAVDLARTAAVAAAAPDPVGDHLGAVADGDRLASLLFGCAKPGYEGWYWSVSVSHAPDSEVVTVNDVVLLPGDDAIVAPTWTPYKDRLRPGDLSPGDVLPPEDDDVRLVPSWSAGDGEEQAPDRFFAREIGLGREHVLSIEGREQAADRWFAGDQGPDNALTQQASGVCAGCGFMVSLAGPLSDRFGVCANGQANDDGRVVSFQHGCGAHSEARHKRSASLGHLPEHVLDDTSDDVEEIVHVEPEPEPEPEPVVEAATEPEVVEESHVELATDDGVEVLDETPDAAEVEPDQSETGSDEK